MTPTEQAKFLLPAQIVAVVAVVTMIRLTRTVAGVRLMAESSLTMTNALVAVFALRNVAERQLACTPKIAKSNP
jgi:hypothetical protein